LHSTVAEILEFRVCIQCRCFLSQYCRIARKLKPSVHHVIADQPSSVMRLPSRIMHAIQLRHSFLTSGHRFNTRRSHARMIALQMSWSFSASHTPGSASRSKYALCSCADDLQELSHEVNWSPEGSKYLSHPPLFPLFARPHVRRYIERRGAHSTVGWLFLPPLLSQLSRWCPLHETSLPANFPPSCACSKLETLSPGRLISVTRVQAFCFRLPGLASETAPFTLMHLIWSNCNQRQHQSTDWHTSPLCSPSPSNYQSPLLHLQRQTGTLESGWSTGT
jgi:hypothetical protein